MQHSNIEAAASSLFANILPTASLGRAYFKLSAAYRQAAPAEVQYSRDAVLAYLFGRMPATGRVLERLLAEVAGRAGTWVPQSSIDVGAGPGVASWAAGSAFPSLRECMMLERDEAMLAVGRALANSSTLSCVRDGTWVRADKLPVGATADLVIASYVLNEVPPAQRGAALRSWWQSCKGVLLIVDPGTSRAAETMMLARAILCEAGAELVAPCSSPAPCRATTDGGCHFGVRLQRTAQHRSMKSAQLGYEDEKYTFLIAARFGIAPRARVYRDPSFRKGLVELNVCSADGPGRLLIPKSRNDQYRAARKARWGDAVDSAGSGMNDV